MSWAHLGGNLVYDEKGTVYTGISHFEKNFKDQSSWVMAACCGSICATFSVLFQAKRDTYQKAKACVVVQERQ